MTDSPLPFPDPYPGLPEDLAAFPLEARGHRYDYDDRIIVLIAYPRGEALPAGVARRLHPGDDDRLDQDGWENRWAIYRLPPMVHPRYDDTGRRLPPYRDVSGAWAPDKTGQWRLVEILMITTPAVIQDVETGGLL